MWKISDNKIAFKLIDNRVIFLQNDIIHINISTFVNDIEQKSINTYNYTQLAYNHGLANC